MQSQKKLHILTRGITTQLRRKQTSCILILEIPYRGKTQAYNVVYICSLSR